MITWVLLMAEQGGVEFSTVFNLMRCMVFIASASKLTLTRKHVNVVDNGVADTFFRLQRAKFCRLTPVADLGPIAHPKLFSAFLCSVSNLKTQASGQK